MSQPIVTDVCRVTPDGRRLSWQLPPNWKRRALAPLNASVAVEHYIASPSEILDLETSGTILSLYRRVPAKLELRTDGNGWVSTSIRAPLAYVPPRFSFSSRWLDEIESINVHFDSSWLARSGLQTDELETLVPRFGVSDDLLLQVVRSIHEDAVAGMPSGPTYAEALAAVAIRRMFYMQAEPRRPVYAHTLAMRKAVEHIRDNFRDPLTLAEIAEAVDYPGDLYSFIRSFKKARGVTPHQYLIETRLQAARDLIERGRCDVTEAALNCGFSTTSHFSAAFRKRWGLSPSALKPRSMTARREEAKESIDR